MKPHSNCWDAEHKYVAKMKSRWKQTYRSDKGGSQEKIIVNIVLIVLIIIFKSLNRSGLKPDMMFNTMGSLVAAGLSALPTHTYTQSCISMTTGDFTLTYIDFLEIYSNLNYSN